MGKSAQAETQWRQCVEQVPEYVAGWKGLGRNLVTQGRLEEALQVSARLQRDLGTDGSVIAALVAESRGDFPAARQILEETLHAQPDSAEALRELSRLLFERFHPLDALQLLERLVQLDPQDASAHCNLGAVYRLSGRPEEALESLQRSLQLRPHSLHARLNLARTLVSAGRTDQAAEAWRAVLELDPQNAESLEMLALAADS